MSSLLQWEPKYSVHNATIDQEHKTLFRLANDVLSIPDPNREVMRFKSDVKQLFHYMEYHFGHEEELMQRVDHPDREAHAAHHKEIVAAMNGLLQSCTSLSELAQRLRRFMAEWIVKHVADEDVKIRDSVDRAAMVGVG